VKAFLGTPAIDSMIAGILYEAIFTFIEKVDIIGNVVNSLPIIGPIRVQIMKEFKKNLSKVVGGQISSFLQGFNRVATQRMVEFVLSPDNKKALLSSNRKLVASILVRPVKSLVPSQETIATVKESLWSALKDVRADPALLDSLYNSLEKVKAEDLPLDAVLDASPTLERNVDSALSIYLLFQE
jgi:hypothetical protein